MRFTTTALISLVAISLLLAPMAHADISGTSTQPRHLLPLIDGSGNSGGVVWEALNASDFLKIVVVVWRLVPNTLYTIWIADCTAQGPPGDYPCPAGGALNDGPGVFGTNSPFCPVPGEGGPLAFVKTNNNGFGYTHVISIPLAGVAFPGIHYAHIDMGIGCVPAPSYPPGFYATPGFSFTT